MAGTLVSVSGWRLSPSRGRREQELLLSARLDVERAMQHDRCGMKTDSLAAPGRDPRPRWKVLAPRLGSEKNADLLVCVSGVMLGAVTCLYMCRPCVELLYGSSQCEVG